MPAVRSSEPCVICGKNYEIMNAHHTVPQCCGGQNSKLVILDASCHTLLHAHALHVLSLLRNPSQKKERKSFWPDAKQEERAKPLVQLIVKAFMERTEDQDIGHPLGCVVDTETWQLFKILASDLGCSQENALQFCIKQTLITKGIKRDKAAMRESELWFLPVPHKRKGF